MNDFIVASLYLFCVGIFFILPYSLQVMYQIGVFISRSSVSVFHFKWFWILSVLQVGNVEGCIITLRACARGHAVGFVCLSLAQKTRLWKIQASERLLSQSMCLNRQK